ncbi:MAG: putative porin [bacterium]
MRRFIGSCVLLCAVTLGLAASARAADTTRELITILRAKGEISEEQYQALLGQIEEDDKAKAKTGAGKAWPEWLDRFSLFGDMRVRGEGFFQNDVTARDRFRVRARIGVNAKASDEIDGTVRLATGDPADPISTNQSLTDLFTRKPITLDQAFLTIKPSTTFGWSRPYLTVTAGKIPNPVFRPKAVMGSELVFDDDLSPEGFSESLALVDSKTGFLRKLNLLGNEWSVKEISSGADAWIFGGQLSSELALGSRVTLTAAFANHYVSQANRIATEANTNSALFISNNVVLKDGTTAGGTQVKPKAENPITRFTGGFNIVNPSLQAVVDTGLPAWPVTISGDLALNTEAKDGDDTGYWVGAGIGQTKNPGDFAFSVAYAHTETDAVVSAFSYSDFGKGGTNEEGPFVKIDWMPLPRLVVTAKNHFIKLIDAPAGKPNDTLYRLQVDAAYTF